MRNLFLLIFTVALFSSCGNPSDKEDGEYLEEEEHLEQKDHTELSDSDSVPDVN